MIIRSFLRYTIAVVAIVAAFVLRQVMVGYLGTELPPYIIFYPVVMLVAMLAGLGPGLLATMVAALLAIYWILPPQGQFAIAKTSDVIALSLFSGMGAFISLVAELYRRARRKAAAYDKELALREAQEALRQSEERLRGAAMAAEIGVWNWNPQTGEVAVSANWKRVFGVADDTAVTFDTWRNALHPEDRDRTVNALMATIEQRLWDPTPEYNVDYRVIWPNGTVRWIVDRGRATYDETGRPISMSGINVDITARKQVEEKIAHLASFPALNPNPIFETDLEGEITYANAAAQRQFPGLVEPGTKHPLLRDWTSVLTVFGSGAKQTIMREVEAEGTSFHQTIHYAAEMGFVRSYLVDITERKQAEAEMAEARSQAELTAAQLRTIVDTVSVGVHVRDTDGYVVLQNEAARNIYGTNQQMVLPHVSEMSKMIETFDLDGRPVPFSEWPISRILRGEHVRSAEMRLRLRGVDKERILSYNGSPVLDSNGKLVMAVMTSEDITERKRAEETLRASLEEKTALLKEVHHRVKNNLQIVSSLLSLQARQVKNPAALETLRDMQGRIRSMALLHETLYREGNAARVNCAVYFSHLCAHLCRAFGQMAERVCLRTDVAPVELGLDFAIPCGLIVNELVSNSFKHAFPDGRRGEITVLLRTQADGRIVLSVADDGIGLSSDVDYQQTGTLGMQLVTGLAKQVAAAIEVKSDPGTIVQISFSHPEEGRPVV